MKRILSLLLTAVLFFSCDVAQQVAGGLAMTQCKYEYKSISGLSLAGVNVQNISSLSSLSSLGSAAGLLSALSTTSGKLPLQFTLNLNVSNPNTQTAILNGLGYILEIDGVQMTTGYLNEKIQVASNQTTVLPVTMAFDLKEAMSGKSLDAIKTLAYNIMGIGNSSSNVTFKLQPSLTIGGQQLKSPSYIPVSFTLNK